MKMLLLLALLIWQILLTAQRSFSHYYPFDSYGSTFRTMMVERDTILLQGFFLDTIPPFLQGMVFAKIDSFGNLISYDRYLDSKGRDLTFPPLNNIIRLKEGGYLTVGISLQDDAIQLIFLNSHFEVDTTFEYFANDQSVQVNWVRSVYELDDGYLIFGSAQRLTFALDGQIFRIDKEGNLLWRKWYGDNNKDEAIGGVVKYTDSTFVVGSFHKPFPVSGQDKRSNNWIFEVDGNGFVLNQFVDPDPFSGSSGGIVIDNFQNIFFAGEAIAVDIYGQHNAVGRIGMLNSDFQLQWKEEFGKNLSINTGLPDMILSDDNLIATGTYVDTFTLESGEQKRPHLGWSVIASIVGDSICEQYDTAQWYNLISSYGRFRAIDTLSSGCIITIGEGRFGPEDNYHEYAWLVKRPNPPCDGMVVSIDDNKPSKPSWVASPNPSSEAFIITLDNVPLAGLLFTIFDAAGHIVRRFSVDAYSYQFKFSTHDLPDGIYLVQSVDKNGRLTGLQKLVVLH